MSEKGLIMEEVGKCLALEAAIASAHKLNIRDKIAQLEAKRINLIPLSVKVIAAKIFKININGNQINLVVINEKIDTAAIILLLWYLSNFKTPTMCHNCQIKNCLKKVIGF